MSTAAFYNRLNNDAAEADRSNRLMRAESAKAGSKDGKAARAEAVRLIRARYTLRTDRRKPGEWKLVNESDPDDFAIVYRHLLTNQAASGVTKLGRTAAFTGRDYETAIDECLAAKKASN